MRRASIPLRSHRFILSFMEEGRWRTLGRDYLYENPWCAFRVDDVELPDGARIEYGVLESGGFAAVVPVTGGGDVVLVRQWRQPLGSFTLELPSGGVDDEEEPERAAHGGLPSFQVRGGEGRARSAARAYGVHKGCGVAVRGGFAEGVRR